MYSSEIETLMHFLSMRPDDSFPVLSLFANEVNSISHFDGGKNNFVYIPGTRKDRVLLVAHADTVWDKYYFEQYYGDNHSRNLAKMEHNPVLRDNIIFQGSKNWGLGADDRAGCAMLWLLRDTGHSILITDGEEHGQISAHHLEDNYPILFDEINQHNYMVQLDRRGCSDYKTYNIPVSREFCEYIQENTGFMDAGSFSRTDIVVLCKKVSGVNLSIGYYNEHYEDEHLNIDEWLRTFKVVKRMLERKQPKFPLI